VKECSDSGFPKPEQGRPAWLRNAVRIFGDFGKIEKRRFWLYFYGILERKNVDDMTEETYSRFCRKMPAT
jgi:hypothetical protein